MSGRKVLARTHHYVKEIYFLNLNSANSSFKLYRVKILFTKIITASNVVLDPVSIALNMNTQKLASCMINIVSLHIQYSPQYNKTKRKHY